MSRQKRLAGRRSPASTGSIGIGVPTLGFEQRVKERNGAVEAEPVDHER